MVWGYRRPCCQFTFFVPRTLSNAAGGMLPGRDKIYLLLVECCTSYGCSPTRFLFAPCVYSKFDRDSFLRFLNFSQLSFFSYSIKLVLFFSFSLDSWTTSIRNACRRLRVRHRNTHCNYLQYFRSDELRIY